MTNAVEAQGSVVNSAVHGAVHGVVNIVIAEANE